MKIENWIGVEEQWDAEIQPEPALRLSALLNLPELLLMPGAEIPLLWHWVYFVPYSRTSDLGSDGHPRRGDFFPPVKLKRRMFAGGLVEQINPLTVGESARYRRTIASIESKTGNNGETLFVHVDIEIEGSNGGHVRETQIVAYTDALPAARIERSTELKSGVWASEVIPDSTLLFRFSALTFNSHRIHYDLEYAKASEGYTDLVVQGPLAALLLCEMARAEGFLGKSITFRLKRPLYRGDTISLRGTPNGDQVELAAYTPSGGVAVEAMMTSMPESAVQQQA